MSLNSKVQWFDYARTKPFNTSTLFTFDEFASLGFMKGEFGCRWLTPGRPWFKCTYLEMINRLNDVMSHGISVNDQLVSVSKSNFLIDTATDDNGCFFNGEVWINPLKGFECYGSTVKNVAMRPALKLGGRPVSRTELSAILGRPDYEMLYELCEQFPNHVVEFSKFTHPVGCLGKYMIVWEIRNY